MQFYRHPTGGPSCLVLPRNEWNKLKKKAASSEVPIQRENEYLKALTEQSRAWIKTWPDTVQGHVAKLAKHKQKQRSQEMATIKAFVAKNAEDSSAEAIVKARQMVFDESCYGKKLSAAFRESKTLEERDVQIDYLKNLRKEASKLEENMGKQELQHCSFGLDKNDANILSEKRQRAIEFAQINKDTFEKQKEDFDKAAKQEQLDELAEAKLIRELLIHEKEAHAKVTLFEKEIMAEYRAEHDMIKAKQAERIAKDDIAIELCKKEQDKLQCKIQEVFKQVQNKRLHNTKSKRIYEIIEKYNEEERTRNDNYIIKQEKLMEERTLKKEAKDKDSQNKARKKLQSVVETNKVLAETARQMQCPSNNKCYCYRQCVLTKSNRKERIENKIKVETEGKEMISHFGPCNKLTAALRKREKEPSPYTGASAAHEQFAKEADNALRDCKYKIAGRKVVDEYRKYNGLDAATLPIHNYY